MQCRCGGVVAHRSLVIAADWTGIMMIRNHIASALPDAEYLLAESLEGHTHECIYSQGELLANEVLQYIQRNILGQVKLRYLPTRKLARSLSLSCIHSLDCCLFDGWIALWRTRSAA